MKIGRLGTWYAFDKLSGAQMPSFLALLERLNYDVLWYPESRGYESLSLAGFLLGNSTKLKIGSSIASIYARDAFTARRGMLSLNSLYGGRFILGLGVSHAPIVQGVRGHTYAKPVPAMRAYLEGITKGESGSEGMANRNRCTRPADAETRRGNDPGGVAVQRDAGTHGAFSEYSRTTQVAGSRAKTAWRPRLGERARLAVRS
jgi:alkanesulfonate monooxygenase SsuD/methylene tetrahydromethanopterin reductase-like flavin-dependent oxidoreductase (luciferase family)